MNKFKKGLSMVMAYLMLISLLPIGLLTVRAKAEGDVPKYTNYNELYFTSVAQYKDQTLVTYRDTNAEEDPNYNANYSANYNNFMQLSLFKNGQESKVAEYPYVDVYNSIGDVAYYRYLNGNDNEWMEYNFSTGQTNKQDVHTGSGVTNEILTDEQKKDILTEVNAKYNKSYDLNAISFWASDLGRTGSPLYVYINGNGGDKYELLYDGDILYSAKNSWLDVVYDKEDTIVILNYGDNSIIRIKDKKIISEGDFDPTNLAILGIEGESFYAMDYSTGKYSINRYELKDKEYVLSEVILDNSLGCRINKDIYGDNWFLGKENDRTFVYKLENWKAVKKYEVAPFMKYLKVYDDNNLVVTSEMGSTIINVLPTDTTIETKPTTTNEGGTTTVLVKEIAPNAKNIINISNEEKEVVVNLKDIQAIKYGTGSAVINLSNGTKINVPFSIIDKALLEGATNVKITCSTIDNSDLIKGLKAVNKVFDFNLSIEYGSIVNSIHQFANGIAEVTLALTDEDLKGLDKTKIKVLYYNEETKKYEVMETAVNGNNITFKTAHFSKFIVAEVNGNGEPLAVSNNNTTTTLTKATTTKTGDSNSNMLLLGAVALVSLGVVTIFGYRSLKKNKVKL